MRLARRAGRVLMPGHTFLYSPPVVFIQELIESGALGELYFISTSRVNLGLHQPDVSVVWDLGPHDFSILRYWLGESPATVSALSRACVHPGHARRRVHQPHLPVRDDRAHRARVARAEQAAAHRGRRLRAHGRVRRHEPASPCGSSTPAPRCATPSRSASTSSAIAPATSSRPAVEPVEPLLRQMQDFCRAIVERVEPRSSAQLGRRRRARRSRWWTRRWA